MNIALVEDNKAYAENIMGILNQESHLNCYKVYNTADDAWNDRPTIESMDVMLLDIGLPDYSGIELLKKLKGEYSNIVYIILTVYEDEDKLFDSLKAGANGYILKSDSPSKIVDGILSTKNGNAPMSMSIAKKICNHFYQNSQHIRKIEQLSPKENEVLYDLSKGLLYKEIADLHNIAIDTVKKHCGNIYRKLHVYNRTEAINIYNNKNNL